MASPTRRPSSSSSSPPRTHPPSPLGRPSRTYSPSPLSRTPLSNIPTDPMITQFLLVEEQNKMRERINAILIDAPFHDPGWGPSDLELVLVSRDGFRVAMDLHREVLVDSSEFFVEELMSDNSKEVTVDIQDPDVLEIFVEAVVLMYCKDLKKKFVGVGVDKVLRLLNIFVDLKFNAGEKLCLEHLEAIPWTEEEGDKVVSLLSKFGTRRLRTEILRRLTREPSTTSGAKNEVILQVVSSSVLKAEDVKGRQQMKSLLSRFLKIDVVSEEVLNQLCQKCLTALVDYSRVLVSVDANKKDNVDALKSVIAREADNLLWVVEILIDKKMGHGFVKVWANQKELAELYQRIPSKHRYDISRITAHLCTSMARRLIMVPGEERYSLLETWLDTLYADFEWMNMYSRNLYGRNFDRNFVEEGLSQTITTLSIDQQKGILMDWVTRFANKGDNCPHLQKAFDLWLRREFVSENAVGGG